MANPEHLDWLREGVNRWNNRRRQDPFDPDLSSEDVSRALGGHEREDIRQISVSLKGVNLSGANLDDATLRDTDLRGAALLGTRMIRANLVGSDLSGSMGADTRLRGAKLRSAKLPETQFLGSDFSAAQLVAADLKGAMFFKCNFKQTHLYSADIIGTAFIHSRPWKALLHFSPDQKELSPVPFHTEGIQDINDLLDACRALKSGYGEEATLYFRGEGRCSWDLRPSVMRASEEGKYAFRSVEADMLSDLMTRQPDAFNAVESALAQWVFAQHHGLKTRLLDITRNPLVALFNACTDADTDADPEDGRLHVFAVPRSLIKPFNSDTIRVISNFAKLPRADQNLLLGKTEDDAAGDEFPSESNHPLEGQELFSRARSRLYAIIRQENPYFEEKIDFRDLYRVFVVEPQRMFERLTAQSGAFLVSAFHERFEREEVLNWNSGVPMYAHHILTIPEVKKGSLLDELRLLNVTSEVLLPSIDEAARAVNEQYRSRGKA